MTTATSNNEWIALGQTKAQVFSDQVHVSLVCRNGEVQTSIVMTPHDAAELAYAILRGTEFVEQQQETTK